MSVPMDCHQYDALMASDLEGELSPAERHGVDLHLAACSRCSALRREITEISEAAAALPLMSPSRDLWNGIAERIEAPVIALDRAPTRQTDRGRLIRMLASAAALVVFTAGTTYLMTRASFDEHGGSGGAVVTEVADSGPRLVSSADVSAGEIAFDRELARLRAMLEERRPTLDTATVAVLERNLAIIDAAIADSRAALERDPDSILLNRQLHNALGRKVQVLRTAALLPSGAD